MTLEEICVKDSTYTNTTALKNRLIKAGLKSDCCEICGFSDKIELHHINGNPRDHRLENLQILCPNCHAFTDNYRGKNIGMSAQEETLDVEPCKFEEPLLGNANGNLEPSLNKEGVETRHKEPKSKDMVKE